MPLGLWGRLFGASMALVLILGIAGGLWIDYELRRHLEARIEEELVRSARVAREALAGLVDPSVEATDALSGRLGTLLDARVTVVAADGVVLGDSEVALEGLARLENHGGHPEIRAALLGPPEGHGVAKRRSASARGKHLYVAVPWRPPNGSLGTVRVALPLHEVNDAVWALRRATLQVLALGAAAAALLAAFASAQVTRDLRRLLTRVQGLTRSAPRPGDPDEVGSIAGAVDSLARQLEGSVSALAAERDRTGAVLESMEEGVILLDADGRIALVNTAAVALVDLERQPLGRRLIEAWRLVAPAELARRALQGAAGTAEVEISVGVGRRLLMVAARPTRTAGAILVLRDITRVRQLETMRRDFVTNLSHELRTPASALAASAEALVAGAARDPVAAAPFIEAIQRNAGRLGKLVSDLLLLSQVETGGAPLALEAVEADEAIDGALALVRVMAERRGQELVTTITGEPVLRADPGALEQILVNLLDNALKYTQEGGRIEVLASSSAGRVRLEVRDNGPGVAPEHRDRLFERFYRVDAGRSRFLGGTGLGLAIVRRLVEAMGGEVSMVPVEPQGASFVVHLPATELP